MKTVIVIPSYREHLALPVFLKELGELLGNTDLVIVADDSPEPEWAQIESLCRNAFKDSRAVLEFSFFSGKSGRGAAVLRGFKLAREKYPDLEFYLECDADGSHRPTDVLAVINYDDQADVVIGSRYLKASQIVGWPFTRTLFSAVLNSIIPRVVGIPVKDITNGLRRYSAKKVVTFLYEKPLNSGFIYLSEQALRLKRDSATFYEIPTIFINRTLGNSTVGFAEIFSSIKGIFTILKESRKK